MEDHKTQFLLTIPFFAGLPEDALVTVADSFTSKNFSHGDIIFSQGDQPDGMYVISFGQVAVLRDGEKLAEICDNGFFGEIALITSETRTATIRVESDLLSVLFLSRESFDQLKKDLPEEVRQQILERMKSHT